MWINYVQIVCFLSYIIFTNGQRLNQLVPESPCPDILKYASDESGYHGIITLPRSNYDSQIKLNVKMSISAQLPTEYVGRLEPIGNIKNAFRRPSNRGFKYKILFPLTNPIPKITRIVVNNKLICSGSPATGIYVTTIDLESRIYREVGANDGEQNANESPDIPSEYPTQDNADRPAEYSPNSQSSIYTTVRPVTSIRTTTPSIDYPIRNSQRYFTNGCGVAEMKSNALIVGGTETNPGDWPWLTALFQKKATGLNFICSGSLVSNHHIITAAHCVRQKGKPTVRADELVIKLGAHNIQDWTDTSAKIMDVKRVSVHPEFNNSNLMNDIAILHVDRIDFNDRYKPVCLWQGNSDLGSVVGKTGSVLGWGRDENSAVVTPLPKLSHLPIVSTETCRGSNPDFFYFTSETTLCAGNRDGTGPCNGDSGGGLYLLMNNQWTLRGIVSSSLSNQNSEENPCSLKDYIIFTDSAKYSSWIDNIINNN